MNDVRWTRGGREVDVGGEGPIFNIYVLNLKASFLSVKTSSSITLRSGVRKRGRALERMVLRIVLAVGPLPP